LFVPPVPAFGAFGAAQNQSAPGGVFGTSQAPATNIFGGASQLTGFGGGSSGFGGSTGLFGSSAPPTEVAHSAAAPQPEDDGISAFEEITGPGPFSEPTTVVTESPLSVSYAVEGESTIPSDGVAHQVSVAVLSFESKVTHVCCPKIEARVYLQVGLDFPFDCLFSVLMLTDPWYSAKSRTRAISGCCLVRSASSWMTVMCPRPRFRYIHSTTTIFHDVNCLRCIGHQPSRHV
jgi:hypothetical protein